jgi:hypothetical protein
LAREKERGSTGVIDTLSAGYNTVNRHPWIVGVPVLVDLFFWLGPRLSLAPLVQRTVGRIAAPAGLPADTLQTYQDYRDWLLQAGGSFNLFSLLTTHIPGIPSLMAGRDGLGATVALDSPWVVLLLFLLLPVAGLWLASIYYVGIGQPVRGVAESVGALWARIWRTWGRLLLLMLLAIGVVLFVGLPLMVVGMLLGALNGPIVGFFAAFLWVVALWVQFYLFFVVDAIVISDVGIAQAIRNSVTVVRFNLGPTMGLVVLIWIITLGMPIVWDAIAQNPIGTGVAILGNAYISAGLAVASMTFYRDRFLALGNKLMGIRGQGSGTGERE